jgi:hypothetical protein
MHNPSAGRGYYNILCADDNIMHCKLVLVAWVADYPEYRDLHHLEQHISAWYNCPQRKLRNYVHSDNRQQRCDRAVYRMLSDANSKAADAELWLCHVY